MKTAVYVRVSTDEQAKEGYSIRAQIDKLKNYIQIKDWDFYKVYADEGISGKNIESRPAINELINDIKTGKVNNIVVYKIDRLTRSTRDLIFSRKTTARLIL
jgi:site-specific DNA recombinase